jgi:hypothetical protein
VASSVGAGELLRGTWFDRSAEHLARQRGETAFPVQFATTFDVELTPLPCLQHLTADERQAECRRIVGEIQAKAEAENKEKGRQPMGVAAILKQNPTEPLEIPSVRGRFRATFCRRFRKRIHDAPSPGRARS